MIFKLVITSLIITVTLLGNCGIACGQEIVQKLISIQLGCIGESIVEDSYGNCFIGGVSQKSVNPSSNSDLVIVKVDSSGTVLWSKNYGGSKDERHGSLIKINDGKYAIIGDTKSALDSVYEDNLIVVIDSVGNHLWSRSFKDSNCGIFIDGAVSSNQLLIVGSTNFQFNTTTENAIIYSFENDGNLSWAKSYDFGFSEQFTSISSTTDGGFVVSGGAQNDSLNISDVVLIKFDSIGTIEWSKKIGSPDSVLISGHRSSKISTDNFNNIYLAVHADAYGAVGQLTDILVLKFDYSGNQIWSRRYGTLSSGSDLADDLKIDGLGNLLLANGSRLHKINPQGDVIWSTVVSSFSGVNEFINGLVCRKSGGFGITGTIAGQLMCHFVDSVGSQCLLSNFNFPPTVISVQTEDIVLNEANIVSLSSDSVAVNLAVYSDSIYCRTSTTVNEIFSDDNILVYPMPFTDRITLDFSTKDLAGSVLKVHIYNMLGQNVFDSAVKLHGQSTTIFPSLSYSGVYIMKIKSSDQQFVKTVIKN